MNPEAFKKAAELLGISEEELAARVKVPESFAKTVKEEGAQERRASGKNLEELADAPDLEYAEELDSYSKAGEVEDLGDSALDAQMEENVEKANERSRKTKRIKRKKKKDDEVFAEDAMVPPSNIHGGM